MGRERRVLVWGQGRGSAQCGGETGYVRRGLIGEIMGPDHHGADSDACANSKIREMDSKKM